MKSPLLAFALAFQAGLSAAKAVEVPVWTKLETWVVPEVAMENLSLGEAVAWVRAKSREIDPAGQDRENAGIRIGFERLGAGEPERLVTVKAKAISLGDLIDRIGRMTNRSVEIHPEGVALRVSREPVLADGMVARVFRVPGNFGDASYYDPEDAGALTKKPDKGSRDIRELLENNGIHFGDGTSAVMLPAAGVLVVRNTVSQMELVEAYFTTLHGPDSGPLAWVVQVESYALANDDALAVTSGRAAGFDGRPILREIGELKEKGEAELVGLANIVTRSGQRAKVEQGAVRRIVTGYVASEGKDLAQTDTVYSGIVLEVDPIVGADGRTIELNIAVDASPEEPDLRTKEILAPVSGKPVRIDEYQSWGGKLQTALTVRDGEPQLLGVIPAGNKTDKAQVVLVTVWLRSGREGFPVPE